MATNSAATGYSNQRKLDHCQNGNLVALWADTTTNGVLKYSTDGGVTWASAAPDIAGFTNGSMFIDLDDYLHVVWKQSGTGGTRTDGYLYYMRGTPNAGRTAWTWSAANLVYNQTQGNYPDIVAHREGTGWMAHLVWSYSIATPNNYAIYARWAITSGAAITESTTPSMGVAIGGTYVTAGDTWPSIDFNHTGDGKTVAGATPHLYVAWSAGKTGAGFGVRFKKATYSAGAWTWGTEREIDNTLYSTGPAFPLNCLFDGTRVLIGGDITTAAQTSGNMMLYERDAADTTTTTRTLLATHTGATGWFGGSMSYDASGNVYFIGRQWQSTNSAQIYTWTRATTTLGAPVLTDTPGNATDPGFSAMRGFTNSRIAWVYLAGNNSPYSVKYDMLVANQSLVRTASDSTTTTDSADGINRTYHRTGADSASATDSATRLQTSYRFPYDLLGPTPPAQQSLVRALVSPVFLGRPGRPIDVATAVVLAIRTSTDSTTTTDSLASLATHIRSVTDSAPAVDQNVRQDAFFRSATDSIAGLADALARSQVLARSIADTSVTTEATSAVAIHPRSVADSASATDAVLRAVVFSRSGTDSGPAADAAIGHVFQWRTATDTLPVVVDTALRAAALKIRTGTDTATATDQAQRALVTARIATDTTSTADAATYVLVPRRLGADTAPAADAATRTVLGQRTAADDAPSVDEQATVRRTTYLAGADAAPALDAVASFATYLRHPADDAPAVEAVVHRRAIPRAVTDAVAETTDAVLRVVALFRNNPRVPPYISDFYDPPVDVGTRFIWVHREATDIAPAYDQGWKQVHEFLAETLPVPTDVAGRLVIKVVRPVEEAPAADTASRTGVFGRLAHETGLFAGETAAQSRALPRAGSDAAPSADVASRTADLRRFAPDAASAQDFPVRKKWAYRTVIEATPTPLDASTSAARHSRIGYETTTLGDIASRGLVQARRALDLVLRPADAAIFFQTHRPHFGPPIADLLSISRLKIGDEPGCDTVEITFGFDRPVTAWEVRVDSTGPHDGTRAAAWSGSPTTVGVATLAASALRHGQNEVVIYGRSPEGVWSFRPTGDLVGAG